MNGRTFLQWSAPSAMAAYCFAVGVALSLTNLPVDRIGQFRLEQRFGFNTSTQST